MNELKISEEQKFFNYLLLYSAKILKYAGNSLNKNTIYIPMSAENQENQ